MKIAPKTVTKLPIFKNRRQIGFLMRTEKGCKLEFSTDVLGEQITYHIKASAQPLNENGVNLPPYFANLLPEGLRLKALVKMVKTSEDDLFSLFAASGHDCVGDITSEPKAIPETSLKLRDVNFYELFEETLKDTTYESVSGVQEKISASMISFPIKFRRNKKRYLLKLNPKDKKNLVENEFHCMELAKACGMNTARIARVTDRDGNDGLMVERFDRVWNEERNDFDFLHQEDGCQILNLYPAQKYLISINDLAKKMTEIVPAPELEILTLVHSVSFSYLVGNGDLHAKNISLQDVPGRPRQLTPAYDLISTCVYGDLKLALKLDGRDDNLSKKKLVDFCNRFGIPTKASQLMLSKLVEKFSKNCGGLLEKIALSEKERSRLERLMKKRLQDLEG